MAKSKYAADYVALEVEKFESKVAEFQEYLATKNPAHISDSKERQSEFSLQLKMMIDIGSMLQLLAVLREKTENQVARRGDVEESGLMKAYENKR